MWGVGVSEVSEVKGRRGVEGGREGGTYTAGVAEMELTIFPVWVSE